MNRVCRSKLAAFAVLTAGFLAVPAARADEPVTMSVPAPELRGIDEWLNTKPLQLKDLKGKVVALHFWTFG